MELAPGGPNAKLPARDNAAGRLRSGAVLGKTHQFVAIPAPVTDQSLSRS